MEYHNLNLPVPGEILEGDLSVPDKPGGLIIFAHGSGSSRRSPRNRFVAVKLQKAGFATLLFDLLTPGEAADYPLRFNTSLLSRRLSAVTEWMGSHRLYQKWPAGYFGASTGASAALKAAVMPGGAGIRTVVSRGGRPDLASEVLSFVKCPVLLLVGEDDEIVLEFNRQAYEQINSIKKLIVIPGATHLFNEPGKLEEVADHAANWFSKYLKKDHAEMDKDFI